MEIPMLGPKLERRKRILAPLLAAVVAGAVVAGVSLATSSTPANTTTAPTTVPPGFALQGAIVNVVQAVSPSVVQIEDQTGLGSGIVFDAAGDIVTNHHVVSGAKSFMVTTWSGRQYRGTLVGAFAPDDLAVIKVSGAN